MCNSVDPLFFCRLFWNSLVCLLYFTQRWFFFLNDLLNSSLIPSSYHRTPPPPPPVQIHSNSHVRHVEPYRSAFFAQLSQRHQAIAVPCVMQRISLTVWTLTWAQICQWVTEAPLMDFFFLFFNKSILFVFLNDMSDFTYTCLLESGVYVFLCKQDWF